MCPNDHHHCPEQRDRYEIIIEGRAAAGLLWPLLDDFLFDHNGDGITRLTGEIRDAAHLHGVMAHLTAVGVELISIAPIIRSTQPSRTSQPERNETS